MSTCGHLCPLTYGRNRPVSGGNVKPTSGLEPLTPSLRVISEQRAEQVERQPDRRLRPTCGQPVRLAALGATLAAAVRAGLHDRRRRWHVPPGGASPPQGPSSTGRSPSWDPFTNAHPIRQGLAVVVAGLVLVPNLCRLNVPATVAAFGHQVLGDVVVRQLVAVVGYGRRVSHGLLLGCG